MLFVFRSIFSFILFYFYLSLDFCLFRFYLLSWRVQKNFDFLYFRQPYWYVEYIVGFNFLCFFFLFTIFFSMFVFSVFSLFFFVLVLFILWLILGYLMFSKKKFFVKHKFFFSCCSYIFFVLNFWFDYHKGKLFCFICNVVFWYFTTMNVPFSFLFKVKYSYERICVYIFCSFCSIVSIFAFVPSFISENL